MEYFELGDLEKFITPKLTERDVKMIGKQLLEGLQVLHEDHLAHRDLKPANIFVARCAPDWWIKLGDFGILRRICTLQESRLTRIGTPDYMAPEILFENDDEDQDLPYTVAVDLWSLGCVLFRLLTHQFPFPELKHLRLYRQSKKPFPTDILIKRRVSEDGISFISDTMKSHPPDRMTVTVALLHSWVSNQECTPTFGDLDDKSGNEGSATASRKFIPVSILMSNLEDNQPFFNAAITSHTKNRNVPHENQEPLQYNSHFTSSQNNETVQLQKPMPDKEEHSSDEYTNILESKSNLADSYLKRGLYKQAMQLFEQILEARRLLLGDEHPDTLKVMNDLANSFDKLGRYQDGMHLHKQTLELRKRILGDEHPDTLGSMRRLALSYSRHGQYQEALQLGKQTLELQKRILGDEHPDTLWSMNDLAVFYFKLGQYQEAMQLRKQTLELRKRILDNEHPDTLRSMNDLAISYSNLGQKEEAMRLRKKTLELRKRILGDQHPDTLRSMNDLAISYSNLGQNEEAMQLRKQTVELRKRVIGDEHPDTLRSMARLARSYSKLGQHQEAVQLGKQTVEAQRRILGPDHPDTVYTALELVRFSRRKQGSQKKELRAKSSRGISRFLPFLKR